MTAPADTAGIVEELRFFGQHDGHSPDAHVAMCAVIHRAADLIVAQAAELAGAREEGADIARRFKKILAIGTMLIDQKEEATRARDEALAALREKEEVLSKAQRTIGHRDRRIARLWAAIEDARTKGYRLPVEEEPPVVLSSAEKPCPHAPTYDAGLCCGHPDDCTFIAPVSREQRGEEA